MAGHAARRFVGDRLVIASHNEGKVSEIRDLLASLGLEPVSAAALGLPEPEEPGASFQANAEIKARAAAKAAKSPALADDSGLVVPALDGEPGLHSARWAGPGRDFRAAMARVERHLFVPEALRSYAYRNRPLPIGHGQTISQPYIVALMTDLLNPAPGQVAL